MCDADGKSEASFGSEATVSNYYNILGLGRDASVDDIRKRYYDECRKYHPDKVAKAVGQRVCILESGLKGVIREANREYCKVEVDGSDGAAVLRTAKTTELAVELEENGVKWHAVQQAWVTLSNPCRRMTYHWKNQLLPRTDAFREQLLDEIRAAHTIDEANMEEQYRVTSERERQHNGLVVLQAWYGDLVVVTDVRPVPLNDRSSFRGPVLDVTTAVQCLVDNRKLVLAAGSQNRKAKLPGFQWLPIDKAGGATSHVYIFYSFRGRLHETTVGETEALHMPQKRHCVQIHNGPILHAPTIPTGTSTTPRPSTEEDATDYAQAIHAVPTAMRQRPFARRHLPVFLIFSSGMLAMGVVGLMTQSMRRRSGGSSDVVPSRTAACMLKDLIKRLLAEKV
eukprot:GEMP01023244.1.p1 GENE.GEMP01023244.1~~GEMP01023244.1.p1  ORF type:complete len:396 (+),score=99.71 GEMP01023244.1:154-1341(+)